VTRHVSVEILALHREGAVSAAKAAGIDAHLAGCARCSDRDAALTRLSSVLAATALPPMPEAFALRIQRAITRESAARAATAATGPASAAPTLADSAAASSGARPATADTGGADSGAVGGPGRGAAGAGGATGETGSAHIPGRPDLPERDRSKWSRRFRMPDWSSPLVRRGLAAAAAVVVIAGAGILLANARTASMSSAGGNSRPAASRPSVHGGAGRQLSNGAMANRPVTLTYLLKGRIATTSAVVGHGNMTEESIPAMVRRRVASVASFGTGVGAPGNERAASPNSLIGGISISTLEGCLSKVAAGRQVLLADVTKYLGTPATMIVLRPPSAADVLDVAIVGLTCSTSNPHFIRTLTVPVH
jgi:hypothetical protein